MVFPKRLRAWQRTRNVAGAIVATVLALGQANGATTTEPVVPAMAADRLSAHASNGKVLGTLVLPSIVARAAPGGHDRPLVVVFNGGPGAASGWLQLGLLGPWQVALPQVAPAQLIPAGDPATPAPAWLQLEPNRAGLWDKSDLLFIDPLGTGFSRAAPGAGAVAQDWRGDGDYLAGAIAEWMERHGRQNAPLVLVGESYGAERAVAVADALSRRPNPARIAGLVLLSQTVVSEFTLAQDDRSLALATGLPTIAATACYWRGRGIGTGITGTGINPADCAESAWRFGMTDYRRALDAGPALDAATRARVAARLAALSGIDPARGNGPGLALNRLEYRRLALADHAQVLGMYDARLAAPPGIHGVFTDPSLAPLLPAMTDAARRASRLTIGLAQSPVDGSGYVLYDPAIRAAWHYDAASDDPESPAHPTPDLLARVLRRSGARLMVAGGLFDTVGSYGADRWLVDRLGLSPDRVELLSYPGGHMFYLDQACRRAFLPVLRHFVEQAGDQAAPGVFPGTA